MSKEILNDLCTESHSLYVKLSSIDDKTSEEYLCLREAWNDINDRIAKIEKLDNDAYEAEMNRSQEFEFKTSEAEQQERHHLFDKIKTYGGWAVSIGTSLLTFIGTCLVMKQKTTMLKYYNDIQKDEDNPKIITNPDEKAFVQKLW